MSEIRVIHLTGPRTYRTLRLVTAATMRLPNPLKSPADPVAVLEFAGAKLRYPMELLPLVSSLIPFLEQIMVSRCWKFLVDFVCLEDGPTAVEYAVMLSLIIVVCLAAITALGQNASTTMTTVANTIGGSS